MPIIASFCVQNAVRIATSRNARGRFVRSIAAETGLFHGCFGKMYRCGSDNSLAFLDGDELVRL